jgi:hypothetical protein
VVVATAETEEELEACTAEAVENEVSIIVGGRLPTDVEGRCVGKPGLLVAAGDGTLGAPMTRRPETSRQRRRV